MRCLAFAETLVWAGWSAMFATRRESLSAVPALSASGHDIRLIDDDGSVEAGEATALAVVDHYGLDAAFERRLATSGRTLVVLDDVADRAHACDILLDPTPGRQAADYAPYVPASARLLLGANHALLRRNWMANRQGARTRLAAGGPVERIIVSMGATDPGDTTSRVLAALSISGVKAHVDVVMGAGAPHLANVAALAGPGITLHVDPPDLPGLAAMADLAIGAPGSSSFERALLGLPAVLIANADNQRFVAAAFAAAGAADVVPPALIDDAGALGARIAALARDGEKRARMSQAAASLSDGRGAMRLLAAVAGEAAAEDGLKVRLRLAETEDGAWLFDLQREPETRRYFRNPAPPSAEEHWVWMRRTLDNPDVLLAIVEAGGVRAGMIRLDRKLCEAGRSVHEVSIAVDPRWHRRGVGAAALALARRLAPGARLEATVLPANLASMRLFERAGYRPLGDNVFRSLPS
jgi:UDP-2,4-diacetamido-2,4,6-trideoxy-beta-L-altropyranose hydrolase